MYSLLLWVINIYLIKWHLTTFPVFLIFSDDNKVVLGNKYLGYQNWSVMVEITNKAHLPFVAFRIFNSMFFFYLHTR